MTRRSRIAGAVVIAAGTLASCWLVPATRAVDEEAMGAPARSRDREQPDVRGRGQQAGEAAPGAQRFDPQYIPPAWPDRERRWQLGVLIENTSRGVSIRRVVPGSAASRAGLEASDVIVTVAGYQVGQVDGVLYDLGDELAIRASGRGDVRLLVLNHRNGRLVNVDARLTPRSPVVRDRGRSPRGFGNNQLESDGDVR